MQNDTVVCIAHTDARSLESSLSRVHEFFIGKGMPESSKDFLGHKIYLVSNPMLNPALSAPMIDNHQQQDLAAAEVPAMGFTVTDTHLVFGTQASLERLIRKMNSSGNATMASAEWFKKAKSSIPAMVGMAGMSDEVAYYENTWKLLKNLSSDQLEQIKQNNLGLLPGKGLEIFDFSLLPDFDSVKKYFGVSASYGISRDDGFYMEFKSINAE